MPTPRHGYYVDGVRVPGVTTIIGRFKDAGGLLHWAWKQGKEGKDFRETRDKAGDVGTAAHKLIELHISGEYSQQARLSVLAPFSEEDAAAIQNAFAAYMSWADQTGIEILDQERQMISMLFRYGGTPDALGRVGDKLLLGDWKTSGGIYPDYLIQLAAYRQLYHENTNYRIDGAFLCRFDKEKGFFVQRDFTTEEMDVGWNAFERMIRLYSLDQRLKEIVPRVA